MIACKIAPESDKWTPTSAATIVRGRRIFMRICACMPSAPSVSACPISAAGISTDPFMMLKTKPTHAKAANITTMDIRRLKALNFVSAASAPLMEIPQDR